MSRSKPARTPRRPGSGADLDQLRRRSKRHGDRKKELDKKRCRRPGEE